MKKVKQKESRSYENEKLNSFFTYVTRVLFQLKKVRSLNHIKNNLKSVANVTQSNKTQKKPISNLSRNHLPHSKIEAVSEENKI